MVLDGAAASLASLTLTTDLALTHGGTGASTAAGARTNLGLVIGTNVQAQSAVLDDLNTLGAASADGEFIVATGAGAFAYESGATARTSLGLGTVATRDTGIGENNIPIFEAGAADDDFLRINGTTIEGRSASEVRGDISAAARGANSDITSLSGLTTALSAAQGGTGLTSLGTAGAAVLALAFGSANQTLAMNETGNGLTFVDASSGDITGVTAGDGLSGGGNSGAVSLALDLNELGAETAIVAADQIAMVDADDNGSQKITFANFMTSAAGTLAGTVTSTGLSDSSGVLSLDIANLNAGGPPLASTDEFVYSDGGTLEKVNLSNLMASIPNNTIDNAMLDKRVISDASSVDAAGGDTVLIGDASDSNNLKKVTVTSIVAAAPQGTVTSVTGGTGLTSTGGTTPELSVDAAQTGITSMTGVNTINSGGNALALGSTASSVTVNGNLIVKGTASFEDAETLRVKDPVIILGSGSSGAQDGGFIVEQSGGETGQFFGYDASAGASGGRFGVAAGINEDATSVALVNFVSTVSMSAGAPTDGGAPLYGGNQGYGAFAVDTTNDDLYVYISS